MNIHEILDFREIQDFLDIRDFREILDFREIRDVRPVRPVRPESMETIHMGGGGVGERVGHHHYPQRSPYRSAVLLPLHCHPTTISPLPRHPPNVCVTVGV